MTKPVTASLRTMIAVLAIAALPSVAGAQAGTYDPTHYWTYHLVDPFSFVPPQPIIVSDQFFTAAISVQTDTLYRLLNWVRKNNSAVTDSFVHYTSWNLQPKLPVDKAVKVTNQFGSYNVHVTSLEFLLVPAWKNFQTTPPSFPQANHYLCYRATGFPPPTLSYQMQDEWRFDIQNPGPMEFLCNPCMKNHQGVTFPIVDPFTHYAVYPIAPVSENFGPTIYDQFLVRTQLVKQFPTEYLFVPSDKTDIPTSTQRGTWGSLKLLYR